MRCEPCGFNRPDLAGPDLHRAHRRQHLSVFPHVDQGTRRTLLELIAYATRRTIIEQEQL